MKLKKRMIDIKQILSLPRAVLSGGLTQITYFYKNSSAICNEENVCWLARELRILTHTIEKGLSLPNVRKGFGKEKIKAIIKYLDKYIEIGNFDYDKEAFSGAVAILERYVSQSNKYDCDTSFINLAKYKKFYKNDVDEYGVRVMKGKAELESLKNASFDILAKERHSVRSFSDKPLDKSSVKKAVELALTAPSACNRQSTRVIHISNRDLCKKILDIQGGAKGHSVSELLLVVSDFHLYRYISEFSTPYLDGGIFLMNLLYSLTYYNIGTCPLIWNDYSAKGEELRKLISVPKNYHVVAVVQIGEYNENGCNYAISRRKAVEDVLIEEEKVVKT